jgi:hypothetical protein
VINLFDGYCIQVDPGQYTFGQMKTAQSGKNKGAQTFQPIGYCSSLQSAMNCALRHIQADALQGKDLVLMQAIQMLNDTQARFEKLIARSIRDKVSV